MKRLFVPASTENDESATYNVIVYKGQGKDAKILYQTVKNDGDEILKNIGKKRRIKRWSEFQRTDLHVYCERSDTGRVWTESAVLFDNQDSWQKRMEIIETILPLLLLLSVTVTGLITGTVKIFLPVWNCW